MATSAGEEGTEGEGMSNFSNKTLLRDVISIPERSGADDYVLRLTEGVGEGRLDTTIEDYVVTDALTEAFDQALDLVAASLKDGTSRASFLSGSFGSGKSHFMAVLYALLGHNPTARAKPELAPVVQRHDGELQGKKVLRLAFHFLDSDSIEQAIFSGYVNQVAALHPDAPLPAVHQGDQLLEDAEGLRAQMGEYAFLAGLNKSDVASGEDDVWGNVLQEGTWTSESYDRARTAAPDSGERQRLVSALVSTYFKAFTRGAEFVSLDEGLAVISNHAKSLGYDAIVMFLDELVLWLAFRVRDAEFFGREAQKLTKFVESGAGQLDIPLITFVARQLDLRKYFVESGGGTGSHQEALDSAFQHQEGRFRTIVLGDDNLPYVAEKRLLKPVSEEARRIIDDAFNGLDRREHLWDVLLDGINNDEGTKGADRQAFRRTYPFSPALVSTLRTLASAMQRDRTALKVMQQLLVDQRDHLTVDDVIPVGDVFDLVVNGNQAITEDMRGRFRNALKLYDEKLRPLLLREHRLDDADVDGLPPDHAFHADDRLVKTLVLSAIASEVPALRELTPGRLASLNHGSIVSPLPGQEASAVLSRLKRWNSEVPEIHISGDNRNPTVRLRISEVDYESVVEKARGEDTEGRRREVLKNLVWQEFGLEQIDGDVTGVSRQNRIWRGSRREVEVIFANIRDRAWLADEMFEAGPDTWRFIIDYPFDEQGHGVREDDQRLDDLRNKGLDTRTVAWVPHFLSDKRQRELGRLAVLDWLLGGSGNRWTSMSSDLAPEDRSQAKIILENQRDALRERMRGAVQEAYGAARPTTGNLDLDEAHERVLISLTHEFTPQAPVGHDLEAAFTNLVDQVFSAAFPGHPKFEPEDMEVKPRELNAVLDAVDEAQQDPDGRVFVDPARRDSVRRVANELGVGYMGETHFLFGADRFKWQMTFAKAMGAAELEQTDVIDVATLRRWIRETTPAPGLRTEVADLVICAWAILQGRAWYRYGSALEAAPKPGSLTSEMELRPEALPDAAAWRSAVDRAGAMFGINANTYLTGSAVSELATQIRKRIAELSADSRGLVEALSEAYRRLGLPLDGTAGGRLATARATAELFADLQAKTDNVSLIETLGRADLSATDQAAGRSAWKSATVAHQLHDFGWSRLSPLLDAEGRHSDRGRSAQEALDRLRKSLTADELAQPLNDALKRAEDDAFAWLEEGQKTVDPEPATPSGPASSETPGAATDGRRTVTSADDLHRVREELVTFLEEHGGARVVVEWRVEP